MRILGIDPGIDRLGWAVIDHRPSKDIWIASGCIITNRREQTPERLRDIAYQLQSLIATYHPHSSGVEQLFFAKNAKTAMMVGEARGVILFALASKKLPIIEVTPNEVKMSITGSGSADKTQVARMVKMLIKLPEGKRLDDELDAIAVALTTARIV